MPENASDNQAEMSTGFTPPTPFSSNAPTLIKIPGSATPPAQTVAQRNPAPGALPEFLAPPISVHVTEPVASVVPHTTPGTVPEQTMPSGASPTVWPWGCVVHT